MSINENHSNSVLEQLARELDISPSDYKRAVESYGAVGCWLEDGYPDAYPGSVAEPVVYPQGSMRLGTVVRPLREGTGTDFDVDLVCELQADKQRAAPSDIKSQVGDRLKASGLYSPMLVNKEGKRCWTLKYADRSAVGFHIDILPCVPDQEGGNDVFTENLMNPYTQPQYTGSSIAITHRNEDGERTYEWRPSNPRGYAAWFENRNASAFLTSLDSHGG